MTADRTPGRGARIAAAGIIGASAGAFAIVLSVVVGPVPGIILGGIAAGLGGVAYMSVYRKWPLRPWATRLRAALFGKSK